MEEGEFGEELAYVAGMTSVHLQKYRLIPAPANFFGFKSNGQQVVDACPKRKKWFELARFQGLVPVHTGG